MSGLCRHDYRGDEPSRVFAVGATDLRKSIDSLAALVHSTFHLDPCSAALFVFCNRERNKLKILEWADHGFWLHYFRLERGHLAWPMTATTSPQAITLRQLQWLLDGLSLEQPAAYQALRHRHVL
ncbi:IS66 family insertion sequence element accessory protein TnpB [Sulfobacillus thermosulfidooxidans]|uniref:IS66 family insertion sequence element accessory protein TnpB n=1 Tax=Sulfobacillus thermosulfidooxidans TaxID=28034 RepID=UPI0006856587|nr:IS66 family insertion sequence element accessory protein TnpB [Sulfobacillus thermosulfidooxidans]